MRILLIVGWLFVGLAAVIFHFGPGQERLELDRTSIMIGDARQSVSNGDWQKAVEQFDRVLASLPDNRREEILQLRLEKCKAQMFAAQLPDARASLADLLDETANDETLDRQFRDDVRSTLANSQYYMTWLMRLEGLPEDEWMPEIESARQNYRLLAENADQIGDAMLAARATDDLESAVRLARMDLGELQGLPLPSQ